MLTKEIFDSWLHAYGKCWETGDSKGVVRLFADDARYYETPFEEPMVGLNAIERYWREGAELAQRDIRFDYSVGAVVDNRGLARWSVSFVRVPSGAQVELEGFLEAEFAADGRCVCFREWWHKKESASQVF